MTTRRDSVDRRSLANSRCPRWHGLITIQDRYTGRSPLVRTKRTCPSSSVRMVRTTTNDDGINKKSIMTTLRLFIDQQLLDRSLVYKRKSSNVEFLSRSKTIWTAAQNLDLRCPESLSIPPRWIPNPSPSLIFHDHPYHWLATTRDDDHRILLGWPLNFWRWWRRGNRSLTDRTATVQMAWRNRQSESMSSHKQFMHQINLINTDRQNRWRDRPIL